MGRPVEKENVSIQIHISWPGLMGCNSVKLKVSFGIELIPGGIKEIEEARTTCRLEGK